MLSHTHALHTANAEKPRREFAGGLTGEFPGVAAEQKEAPLNPRYRMTMPLLFMNAMVDSITDTVETTMICGHHAGGLRHYML